MDLAQHRTQAERQAMKLNLYRITSRSGADHGVWQGRTPSEALCKLHRSAGYDVMYDAYRDCVVWRVGPVETEAQARAKREECGDVEAWHFERVSKSPQ